MAAGRSPGRRGSCAQGDERRRAGGACAGFRVSLTARVRERSQWRQIWLPNFAVPLLALGRGSGAAALAVGSTAARLALGLARGAVQVTVFVAALFYLLATEEDPLAATAGLLPLSGAAQARVIGVLAGTISACHIPCLYDEAGDCLRHFRISWLAWETHRDMLDARKQYGLILSYHVLNAVRELAANLVFGSTPARLMGSS